MSTIPAILKTEYDFSGEEMLRAFTHLRLSPFRQDVQDWTNPDTGEFFPATFDYFATLAGRRKADSVDFCVQLRVDHKITDKETGTILEAYIKSVLMIGVISLADFANCACTAGDPCSRHPR